MTLAASLKALDALSELNATDSLYESSTTAVASFAPSAPTGTTFVWKDAANGSFVGTGWLSNGATGVPEAGDTADMSVTGANPYKVLMNDVTITVDNNTWTFDDYVVGNLILGVETTLEVDPNSFDLQYGAANAGTILVDSTLTVGDGTGNNVIFDGSGFINLNNADANATLTGSGTGTILDLFGQRIIGSGTISNLTIYLDPNSSIATSNTMKTLTLNPGSGGIYNEGALAAYYTSTLLIESTTVNQGSFIPGDAAGYMEAGGAGAKIDLYSVHIEGGGIHGLLGGVVETMDPYSIVDGSTDAGSVTILGDLLVANGNNLTVEGTIDNEGTLEIQGNTQLTVDGVLGVTFDSGGTANKGVIAFDDSAGNVINTNGNVTTLTNVDNTISGAVHISNMTIVNEAGGTIDATGPTNQIIIDGSDKLENSGLVEATGKAGLYLSSQVIDAALGGKIVAGAGSLIDIASDTFQGGTISAVGTGEWVLVDPYNVLDGSTNSGAVTVTTTLTAAAGNNLELKGAIHNEGTLAIDGNTQLTIDGTKGAMLDSGGLTTKGQVTFDDSAGNVINTNGNATTLTNVDNTISGAVHISNITIINKAGGTIDATGTVNQLVIDGSDKLENSGLVEATGAAGLYISGQVIDGALKGKIVAGAGSLIDIASDTFQGGTISALGTGKWVLVDPYNVLDGSTASGAVTVTTTLTAAAGNNLELKGAIHNEGALAIQGNTQLTIDGTTGATLDSGGLATKGQVTFGDSAGNVINTNGNATTLTNVDNTISGAVHISNMTIVNDVGGTIDATGKVNQFIVDGSDRVINAGLLEATGAAGLYIAGVTVKNTGGTISAGAGSKVELLSDSITLGTLQTTGTGIIEIADSGTSLSASNVANGLTLAATIQIDDGQLLSITGSVVNSGKIEVGVTGGATLELGATLSGGGSIVLFDSASSAITVGFNNVNNTISGAGKISATIQQQTGGVIEATHLDNALILATGVVIANGGVLEANAGELIVDDAVTGAGSVVITNGGSASFAAAFSENVNFLGANAGALDLTDAYTGTVTGFGVGDSIELLGLSADSVSLNALDQLVVKSGTTTVATIQLAGNYAGDQFLTETNAKGVEVIEVLAPTVAQYLADKAHYDAQPWGFDIVDSASSIQASLAALAADAHIDKIVANSGVVTVLVATFTSAKSALNKVVGGFTISDTASNIVAALSALSADAAHIHSIAPTSGTVTVSTAQFNQYHALLNTFVAGFTVADTAADILSDLAALRADIANIGAITITNGALTVTATLFAANRAALDKISGGFAISDTAANIVSHLAAIDADLAHINSLTVSGKVVVAASQAVNNRAALDKIAAGYSISDTAANIQTALASLFADTAKIVSITSTSGAVTVSDAVFEVDRALLDKVSPGIVIRDLGAKIVSDLAGLLADNSHIASLVATDSAPSVAFATFKTYASVLNKVVGGFAIRDIAAAITTNFAAIVADTAHIASITSTDAPLKFGATAFVANETTLNKVTGGVAISDTTTNIEASAFSLLGDLAHIQSVYFTDVGTPTLKLTAVQVAEVQPILSKIANNYVLDDLTAPGVTITTGHGNFLTIGDVPTTDTINGGGTNETFVFGAGLGHATLVDFSSHLTGTTHDTIQLSALDFGSFTALTGQEASQHGSDVWLQSKTSSDLIVIDNLTTQTLGALSADFRFV